MSNRNFVKEVAFNASEYSKERDFWVKTLSGELSRASFPGDFGQSGAAGERRMAAIDFQFTGELYQRLMHTANNSDLRVFMILSAALAFLMSRYSAQDDVILGTSIDKQESDGQFINTILALRFQLTRDMSFKDLLIQARQVIKEAREHQNFPLETLPYELGMDSPGGGEPLLFDTAILLESIHDRQYIEHLNLDMLFSFVPAPSGTSLKCVVEYNRNVYGVASVEKLAAQYRHFLDIVLDRIAEPLDRLDILPGKEREYLLYGLNETNVDYPACGNVLELFRARVEETPGAVAVEEADTGRTITYEGLDRQARQLAAAIRERGVQTGAVVAVMGERTLEMVGAILGILTAGCVFLPLDGQNPDERIRYILKDSGAGAILSQTAKIEERSEVFGVFPQNNIIVIDDDAVYNDTPPAMPVENGAGDPAYIIYTSGTTGKPKGVVVQHGSLVNYIRFSVDSYTDGHSTGFPFYTSISFDLTLTSIFTPLVTGGAVVVYSGWNKGNLIERIVDDGKVQVVKLTPSHLSLIGGKQVGKVPAVKRFVVGGEALKYGVAREIWDDFGGAVQIYNEYGPTEATVGCMIYSFDAQKDAYRGNSVSIGEPAANARIYLLDRNLEPVPFGAVGEMYVSGSGVARGYLNRPELTAEKFLADPFAEGALMYRTGDLARRHSDGNIEFLGRIDHQVKVRGFRIELGEIENRLLEYDGISGAVVIVRSATEGNAFGYQTDDKQLCAYVVTGEELNTALLREFLAETLPDYMIPAFFVPLERMPLTPNGKVDTRALPEPVLESREQYVAPGTPMEKSLVEIWAEVLGMDIDKIGSNSNFFQLGGHSLSGTVLAARIHKQLGIKLALVDLFRLPVVKELALHLEKAEEESFVPVEPVEKREYYALSSAQDRLYMIQQMDLDSIGYNLPMSYQLQGNIRVDWLETVFKKLVARHDSFRTAFIMVNDKPVQRVLPGVAFEIEHFDVTPAAAGGDPAVRDQLELQVVKDFIRPFDLTKPPLLRVGLAKQGDDRFVLLLDMHHVIADAFTMDILIKEFWVLYSGEELPPLKLQYRDFSQWQNSTKVTDLLARQEQFWLNQFEGEIPVLELPADFARPPLKTGEGRRLAFSLSQQQSEGLRRLAADEDVTFFMLMSSIFFVYLAKLSGQEDIVVGSPIAGRRHTDLEKIVGIFINNLSLRNYPKKEKSFRAFLKEAATNALDAFENQDYQYEELVAKVAGERNPGRQPLMDVLFILNNVEFLSQGVPAIDIPDLEVASYSGHWTLSRYDLEVICIENPEAVSFLFVYALDLFKEETILRFIEYYKQLVDSILEDPGRLIGHLDVLHEEERNRLLVEFNKTDPQYPVDKTLHRLFDEQVERTPQQTALSCRIDGDVAAGAVEDDEMHFNRLTYRELSERADRLAGHLIARGVGIDDIVGLFIGDTLEQCVAMLGVLKSGGAYLPISADYPLDSAAYIVKDSRMKVLVTGTGTGISDQLQQKVPGLDVLPLDGETGESQAGTGAAAQNTSGPDDLAYVIYTSGSTGRPKGVLVNHRGVVNYTRWRLDTYAVTPGDVTLQLLSYSFDGFGSNFYSSLLSGGGLQVVPESRKLDYMFVKEIIKHEGVTNLSLVPGMYDALLGVVEPEDFRTLRFVVLAGERASQRMLRRSLEKNPGILHINEYGPTEATVTAAASVPLDRDNTAVIGKPIANATIYILGEYMKPQPMMVAGELCIAGAGVARGYLNNPELTAEKFVTFDRSDRSYRTYKTGDLARWLPNGTIEFLGRKDQQVKIRGHRIELGEIEKHLLSHEKINDAAVIAVTGEDDPAVEIGKQLHAYIVADKAPPVKKLKTYLAQHIPDYMIPAYFVKLDEIPLTANGKVDEKALPKLSKEGIIQDKNMAFEAPADDVERKIAAAWASVLGLDEDKISTNRSFFEIGGDSINAIQVSSRLLKAGLRLEIKELLLHPTIKVLKKHVRPVARRVPQGAVSGEVVMTPIQQWFKELNIPTGHHFNMSVMLYRPEGFDEANVAAVARKIAAHHDALRMVFKADGSQWNRKIEEPLFHLEVMDFRGQTGIEEKVAAAAQDVQASMDLENGPLLRLGLFHTDDGSHLLLAIHHLVVDGVSWRIILEDFEDAWKQLEAGGAIRLQKKTDSFKTWAKRLQEHAAGDETLAEKDYWLKIASAEVLPLPGGQDQTVGNGQRKDNRARNFFLDETETGLLLTDVHQAYNTEVNDILLTGLAEAVKAWCGMDRLWISLEGHGRESIIDDIDISRTVGWFSSQYPVLLDVNGQERLSGSIKQIKETLRSIPRKGIGCGILRYLSPLEEHEKTALDIRPEVSFNYLGRFGQENSTGKEGQPLIRMSHLSKGEFISPEFENLYRLTVIGIIVGGKLKISLEYHKDRFDEAEIEKLADCYKTALTDIIAHCTGKEESEMTPSDFSAAELDSGDMDAILEDFED